MAVVSALLRFALADSTFEVDEMTRELKAVWELQRATIHSDLMEAERSNSVEERGSTVSSQWASVVLVVAVEMYPQRGSTVLAA